MPDGRELLFGTVAKDVTTQVWRVPSNGGKPVRIGLSMSGLRHLRVHPDGRQIAFAAGSDIGKNEVWAMQNFLPPVAKAVNQDPAK